MKKKLLHFFPHFHATETEMCICSLVIRLCLCHASPLGIAWSANIRLIIAIVTLIEFSLCKLIRLFFNSKRALVGF